MVKDILLLGDSHTYGAGIDDASLHEPWNDYSKKSWAYHMFDQTDIVNKSYPGCSNDVISLKLVRHAHNKGLILIMFTYPERIHFTKNSCNFNASPRSFGGLSDDGKEDWAAKQLAIKHKDQYTKLITNYYDDNLLELLFLKNVLFCQSFCKSNNLEYYFTLVDHRERTRCTSSLKKYIDGLYQNIDWNKIFLVEGKYGFDNYANKINAGLGTDNDHWGEDYHRVFGDLFLDWINKEKVL